MASELRWNDEALVATFWEHVGQVLARLREHNLFCELEKCLFEQPQVPFLGYILSGTALQMDSAKLRAIVNWPLPTGLKAIQCFLGFVNYYRQFIKGNSTIIAPITALTKKSANPKLWSPKAISAFEHLKSAFFSLLLLFFSDLIANVPSSWS
ncbi:uncharacterized protein LOC142100232 [Mixophyes fleayi]|uniref:uncharacterized protein LOC142100232 n=1 Tax=Mixophyes fleayi TaxID=3061075 RepID=UPI003F4E24C6